MTFEERQDTIKKRKVKFGNILDKLGFRWWQEELSKNLGFVSDENFDGYININPRSNNFITITFSYDNTEELNKAIRFIEKLK